MRKAAQRRGAAILAGVAWAGLVLGPALHAEAHLAEQRDLRERALSRAFALAFACERSAAGEELAHALEIAFGTPDRGHPGEPGHSHGPGGRHGAGSLSHFALAVDAPPAVPLSRSAPPPLTATQSAPAVQHAIPRYLVPERSQAPPAS